jgi:hypothetical protein
MALATSSAVGYCVPVTVPVAQHKPMPNQPHACAIKKQRWAFKKKKTKVGHWLGKKYFLNSEFVEVRRNESEL